MYSISSHLDGATKVLNTTDIFQLCTFKDVHDIDLQYNSNGSNQDGSFTLDDSNSFFSPYKILPIAQENKYLPSQHSL